MMLWIIIIVSILIYCLVSGIAKIVLYKFTDLGNDGSIVCGVVWPLSLPAVLSSMLVNRIIDGKRQKEIQKDVKISDLKQDVLRKKTKPDLIIS